MTKAKFIAFEKVRKSGLANIYNIDSVRLISAKYGKVLSVKDCIEIMLNYDKYYKKYIKDEKL